MTKNDLMNDVIYDMAGYLDQEGNERLKTVLIFRLRGFRIVDDETLPSVIVKDNQWIMERYAVDLTAQGKSKKTIRSYLYIIRNSSPRFADLPISH